MEERPKKKSQQRPEGLPVDFDWPSAELVATARQRLANAKSPLAMDRVAAVIKNADPNRRLTKKAAREATHALVRALSTTQLNAWALSVVLGAYHRDATSLRAREGGAS